MQNPITKGVGMPKTEAGNPLPEPLVKPSRMVLVQWRDAVFAEDYETAESMWPWVPILTIGFVLRQDADGIVVGQSQDDREGTKQMRRVSSIPAAYILKIEELGVLAPVAEQTGARRLSS